MRNIPAQERLNRIPRLYAIESTPLQNKLVYLHFFIGNSDWYECEFDGDDLFFGCALLNGDHLNAEWGYFSFSELRDISINGIEADLNWKIYGRQSQYLKYLKSCRVG